MIPIPARQREVPEKKVVAKPEPEFNVDDIVRQIDKKIAELEFEEKHQSLFAEIDERIKELETEEALTKKSTM